MLLGVLGWRRLFGGVLLAVVLLHTSAEPALEVDVEKTPLPDAVPEAFESVLSRHATMVLDAESEEPLISFWMVERLRLAGPPTDVNAPYGQISDGTLLGIVRIHEERRDFRNDSLPAGVYSLRFAEQPYDRDHMGIALYPYFALFADIRNEECPDVITEPEDLFTLASKDMDPPHPRSWNLKPSGRGFEPLDIEEDWEDHTLLHLRLRAFISGDDEEEEETPVDEDDEMDVRIAVVFEGVGYF